MLDEHDGPMTTPSAAALHATELLTDDDWVFGSAMEVIYGKFHRVSETTKKDIAYMKHLISDILEDASDARGNVASLRWLTVVNVFFILATACLWMVRDMP